MRGASRHVRLRGNVRGRSVPHPRYRWSIPPIWASCRPSGAAGSAGQPYLGVHSEQLSDTDPLAVVTEDVEAGGGPVALVRPGHRPVVLVSAEEWARLDELETA